MIDGDRDQRHESGELYLRIFVYWLLQEKTWIFQCVCALILLLLNTTSGGSNQGLTRQFKLVPDRIGKYSIKQ